MCSICCVTDAKPSQIVIPTKDKGTSKRENTFLSLFLKVDYLISVAFLLYNNPVHINFISMITSTTYAQARQNLKTLCDQVCADRQAVLVQRRRGGNVVILSEEDYQSLAETAHLLSSPKNAERLIAALQRDKSEKKVFKNIDALRYEVGI